MTSFNPQDMDAYIANRVKMRREQRQAQQTQQNQTGPMDDISSRVRARIEARQGPSLAEGEKGAGFLDRAVASFTFGPESEANYYRKRYGSENVRLGQDNRVEFAPKGQENVPPQQRRFYPVDPEGFDIGDIADVSGPLGSAAIATAIAPQLAGAAGVARLAPYAARIVGTGRIAKALQYLGKAAGIGAIGEGIQQVGGALVPGEENVSPSDRAERVALSAGLEAALPVAGKQIARAGRVATAGAKRGVAKAVDVFAKKQIPKNKFYESAEQLSKETKIPFTEPEKSQGENALLYQGYLGRNPYTAEIIGEAQDKSIRGLTDYAREAIKYLGDTNIGKAAQNWKNAYTALINKNNKALKDNAARLFGEFEASLPRDADGKLTKNIKVNRFLDTIDGLMEKYRMSVGSSEASALVKFLGDQKKSLKPDANGNVFVDARDYANMLSEFSKKSKRPEGFIKDIEDRSRARQIAVTLLGGLEDSMNDSMEGLAGESLTLLQKARDQYKVDVTNLNNLMRDEAEKFFEKPEEIIHTILSPKASEQQIDEIFKLADEISPTLKMDLRSAVMDEVFQKSKTISLNPVTGVEEALLSPAKLVSSADKNLKNIRVLMKDDPEALKSFNNMIKAGRILSKSRKSLAGSPTGIINIITADYRKIFSGILGTGGAMGGYATGGIPGAVTGAVSGAATSILPLLGVAFTQRAFARALTDPKAMDAYATIFEAAATPNKSKMGKALESSLEYLGQFIARTDALAPSQNAQPSQFGTPNEQFSTPEMDR